MRRERQEGRNAGVNAAGGVPGVNAAGKAGRQECWR